MNQRLKTKWGDVVETGDGSLTIRHNDIDEEYHSKQGALSESQTLYLERSGFHESLRGSTASSTSKLQVLDVGLGLGYNALSTISAWYTCPAKIDLYITSLEINPDLVIALSHEEGPWMKDWADQWLEFAKSLVKIDDNTWQAEISHPIDVDQSCSWRVVVGDASEDALFDGSCFDYIWQDPFSPKKNPEMWSEAWFRSLLRCSHGSTRLMTYSVARGVRDNLEASGWQWEKIPASGAKRHWLTAMPNKN